MSSGNPLAQGASGLNKNDIITLYESAGNHEEATSFKPALSNAAAENNEPTICNIWTCNSSVK